MNKTDQVELERWIDIITQKAVDFGLDFYPAHFEVVPDYVIYELGSYGLPARFSHWTFGRDYHQQKTMYEYGMSKIYEIVFNSNPCQAFLMDSNSMLSHKFVVAHVLGHNDFFKNNIYFEHTDRQMIEKVRLHANRIRRYEDENGKNTVEDFLDSVLSIEYHFDTATTTSYHRKQVKSDEPLKPAPVPTTEFDDLWNIVDGPLVRDISPNNKFPQEPDRDLLGFLRDYAPELTRWQRDIMNMVREEMIYFIPQIRTKIMNEGWASYWHERIMTDLDLTPEEHLEFRKLHSSVLSPGSKMSINPYYVGYNIFRDIERRWNGEPDEEHPETDWLGDKRSRPDAQGMLKIFDVRRDENDLSFLRKYLTEGLITRLDMFTYRKDVVNGEQVWVVADTDWRNVRDTLLESMTNMGMPIIEVENGDYRRRGELLLKHASDGKPLDTDYTQRTMRHIYALWKRPVHIQTEKDGKPLLFSYDGEEFNVDEIWTGD